MSFGTSHTDPVTDRSLAEALLRDSCCKLGAGKAPLGEDGRKAAIETHDTAELVLGRVRHFFGSKASACLCKGRSLLLRRFEALEGRDALERRKGRQGRLGPAGTL